MVDHDLEAVVLRVAEGGEPTLTIALGESMTGVPATADMHFRNGAVAISFLVTLLLQLVDEGTVGLDDTIADSTAGYVDCVYLPSTDGTLVADPSKAWTEADQLDEAWPSPCGSSPAPAGATPTPTSCSSGGR